MERKLLILLTVTTVLWAVGVASLRLDILLMFIGDRSYMEDVSRHNAEADRACLDLSDRTEYQNCMISNARLSAEQVLQRWRITRPLSMIAAYFVPPAILWGVVLLIRRYSLRSAVGTAAIAATAVAVASMIAAYISYQEGLLPLIGAGPKS